MMMKRLIMSMGLTAGMMCLMAVSRAAEPCLVYTGSYSDAKNQGIQVFQLEMNTGALTKIGGVSGVKNPSFLAIHPSKKFLYSVAEIGDFEGKKMGAVAAFSLDERGIPVWMNSQVSEGQGPCHVFIDKAGKNALVANYGSGSVGVLPLGPDGRLEKPSCGLQHKGTPGPNRQRQQGPHAHSINLDEANRFAFVADLGLDKIFVYKFEGEKGRLASHDPPACETAPGSGPRHFAFHPGGKYAYANGELTSTVMAFTYDRENGLLKEPQSLSTLPNEVKGNTTAEVQVSPDGKFVYVSNRGHNSVAVFAVDESSGKLKAVGHCPTGGKTPRNFGIDPSGRFLLAANQDSNTLVVFKIDPATGMPSPTGYQVEVTKPTCVKFLMIR